MFSFLSRMHLPGFGQDNGDDDRQAALPLPATHKYQDKPGHRRGDSVSSLATLKDGRPSQFNTLNISAPILRSSPSSITGFDNDNFFPTSNGGSSSASASSGSMVTAYQYHQPTSFSALHQYQQQQASSGVGNQSQKFYQNPAYSQSLIQLHGPALSRTAPVKAWISSDEIGVAIGGEEDSEEEEEEEDMTELSPIVQERIARYANSQFPAVIRLDSGDYSYIHEDSGGREYAADLIGRSASAPPGTHVLQHPLQYQQNIRYATYGLDSSVHPSVNAGGPSLFDLRLNLDTNAQFAQSVQSLRLVDHIAAASTTDVFAGAYDYPRAKQLSPIAEVDYVSPDSLKKTKSLPFMSNFPSDISAAAYSRQNTNNTTNTTNISPGGASQGSEVTRPSPVYSSPFITRPLNRTVSQTSSRTHVSTSSSVPTRVTTAAMKPGDPPPTLPPLDLKPPFPGPHPSQSGTLRPPKPQRTFGGLSTIVGSDESGPGESKYTSDDVVSLHADSFVTASTRGYDNDGGIPPSMPGDEDYGDDEEKDEKVAPSIHRRQLSASGETMSDLTSVHSGCSRIRSGSESFIVRRWESDAGYGSGGRVAVLRTKKKARLDATPAFWAFWLGFICPFLWLIGGWHFTSFGEQPPKLTFWEFYFNTGYWKFQLKLCFGQRKIVSAEPEGRLEEYEKRARHASKKGKDKQMDPPPVTRWVAEKQTSEQRRERLYDPKRSMRGILFGYPFIARPMRCEQKGDWTARALGRLVKVIAMPNRLFDELYGVKLTEVRGRPETTRRMFDPWIQRCRYAFCYALIVVSIGLCITSTYLIIYNTRQLRA